MKKALAMLLALVMLFALAACSNNTNTVENTDNGVSDTPNAATPDAPDEPDTPDVPELSGEPIKIGHIADLTGSEALTGAEAKRSLEFAAEQLSGIAGRPVEVITRDAQGTANGAADAARMLVESDGVVAIFGPNQAGQKTAVSEYCADVGIPLILYNGTPSYLFATNPWLIGVGGANPQMTVMADFAYNGLGYRTVNIVTMDNIGFKTFTDDFTSAFEALGGRLPPRSMRPSPATTGLPI